MSFFQGFSASLKQGAAAFTDQTSSFTSTIAAQVNQIGETLDSGGGDDDDSTSTGNNSGEASAASLHEEGTRDLPWECSASESKSILSADLKEAVLVLSLSDKTFTTEPPYHGVCGDFIFNFDYFVPIITRLLAIDKNLVAKHSAFCTRMDETLFWKNYFCNCEILRRKCGMPATKCIIVKATPKKKAALSSSSSAAASGHQKTSSSSSFPTVANLFQSATSSSSSSEAISSPSPKVKVTTNQMSSSGGGGKDTPTSLPSNDTTDSEFEVIESPSRSSHKKRVANQKGGEEEQESSHWALDNDIASALKSEKDAERKGGNFGSGGGDTLRETAGSPMEREDDDADDDDIDDEIARELMNL
jgi:hypothetical protein